MGFVPISRDIFGLFQGPPTPNALSCLHFLIFGKGGIRIISVLMETKLRPNGDKMETEWRENGDKMEMKWRQNGGKKGTTI